MKNKALYIPLSAAVIFLQLFAMDVFLQNLFVLYLCLFIVAALYLTVIYALGRLNRRAEGDFIRMGLIVAVFLAAVTFCAGFAPYVRSRVLPFDIWASSFFILANAGCLALAAILRRLFEDAFHRAK